ncbi:HAMP domain-containing histidine kinase [Corynebacterium aquatimens]|uniref:histidine kinase dimerization/phospho-acceptor domain-containing protein n=1 Tax=Corynebacterium aquatimens TaxID=1190508 RepID=UPI00253FF520|nr:histidine kinase dimerization/phospho-acceptor domain-containing protein [Corynebacterium aquatimens]QYH20057.1 HAMP domain-containing histidine kinase [Corynebacterium aquatimens]
MILRQSAEVYARGVTGSALPRARRNAPVFRASEVAARGLSLKRKLALITGAMVVITVVVAGGVGYRAATATRIGTLDAELVARADALAQQLEDCSAAAGQDQVRQIVDSFKVNNPHVRVAVTPAWSDAWFGDPVPVGGPGDGSGRTIQGERVVALRTVEGDVVALAQVVDPEGRIAGSFGGTLLMILILGGLLTLVVASAVPAVAVRPLRILQRASEDVSRTEQAHAVPVEGEDEMAEVNRSFNKMVQTLMDSRARQSQVVADAGHELKTPLTSLRTNIELLIMARETGRETELDLKELGRDVIDQMDAVTALISDLVDLAREDAPGLPRRSSAWTSCCARR